MKHPCTAFLLFALAQASFGQLSGPLSGTLGPGEYHVVGDIWIDSGNSLRLLPGTTFTFDGYYSFGIYGTLLAEATEADSIIFTTDTLVNPDRWRGLRFLGSGSSGSRLAYCVIQYGRNPNNGGGVFIHESSLSFIHCTINNNSTEYYGGGVYCEYSSSTFINCTFSDNSSEHLGGAVCFLNSAFNLVDFRNCAFNNNFSESSGGAIYGGYGDFTNCTFNNNTSGSGGGGVCRSNGDFTDCIFTGNSCGSSGGAVRLGEGIFRNCTIIGNSAEYFGGGIYDPRGTYVNCIIVDNLANHDGGGIYCNSIPAIFINCVIIGNSVPNGERGGNVYCRCTASTLKNTIIAFSEGAEGIFFDDSRSSHIEHCAFFGNSGGNFDYWTSPWEDAPANLGVIDTLNANGDSCDTCMNIYLNPLLRDIENGDYHLMATYCGDSLDSPCIDAGDPSIEDHTLSCDFGLGTLLSDIGAYGGDTTISGVSYPDNPIIPASFALFQNYPNPFNSATTIRYDVKQTGQVRLTIYNLLGQEVTQLLDKQHQPGSYTISWNATNFPSGLYFCRMQAPDFAQTRKLLLVK